MFQVYVKAVMQMSNSEMLLKSLVGQLSLGQVPQHFTAGNRDACSL